MVNLITIFIYLPIVGCERITYQDFSFLGIIHRKNATAFKKKRSNGDHLGNVRLSYSDTNNNGTIEVTSDPLTTEIVEENNYYPFGLKHKGYNNVVTSTNPAQDYKYNGIELEESLNLNLYEMDMRQYDPAIARFTSIDPVVHHSMSTYTAFDNNPVYWADPSGADSASSWQDAIDQAMSGGATTWYSDGNGGITSNKPKEGESKTVQDYSESTKRGVVVKDVQKIYHSGGLGYDSGWYSEKKYSEIVHSIAVDLAGSTNMGKGFGSVEWLSNVDAIEGFKEMVLNYSSSIYGQVQAQNYFMTTGQINTDDMSTLMLFLPALRALNVGKGGLALQSSTTNVMGKSYTAVGEVVVPIKNTGLLKALNSSSKGDWVKVYEAAIQNGSRVETHYFRNNTTGKLFDVKLKYNKWHQKAFKNIGK